MTNQSPASKIEDYKVKNPESSGSQSSSPKIDNQDEISSKQIPVSKTGEYEGNKIVQEPVLQCRDETMSKAVFSLFQQFVMNFVHLSHGMVSASKSVYESQRQKSCLVYDTLIDI